MRHGFHIVQAYRCCKGKHLKSIIMNSVELYSSVNFINLKSSLFSNLPAISWNVLVMIKSVVFIAIMSAVNWHEK